MPRRRLSLLAAVGLLLMLGGCQTPLSECSKTNPPGSAAFQACVQAVLQQQNEMLNRMGRAEYRSRQ